MKSHFSPSAGEEPQSRDIAVPVYLARESRKGPTTSARVLHALIEACNEYKTLACSVKSGLTVAEIP